MTAHQAVTEHPRQGDRKNTMTFQSTIASIQNIRKQRQLELELVELDRKWHVELKGKEGVNCSL